jgi:opacity protein-like surface antigen
MRIVTGILPFVFATAHASSYQLNPAMTPHHWYADVGIGKSYDYGSSNVIVPMENAPGYMLYQTNQAAAPPFFSAAIGHLWSFPTTYLPFISVGLQYRYTAPIVMSGVIYDITGGNVNLDQSLFDRYQIKQQSYSVLTKMDLYRWQNFMPYFSFGLGASWNRINQFSTLAFSPTVAPLELLANTDTNTDFTYSLGVGIDYMVNQDLWLSLGYAYDDFGKNAIGQLLVYTNFETPLEPIGTFEKNATLHAHNILLTARYLFA